MEMLSSVVSKKLELVNKLHQKSILPFVQIVGQGKRLKAPLVVDLDPTTFCDLACPECISKNLINQGQLGKDSLLRLAGELAESGVKAVILIGGGEPLMHKSVGAVMRTLSDANIHIGLVSNGTLLHRHMEEVSQLVSWTRISMDAATAETHMVFRPSGRANHVFPTIINNMEELARRKKGKLGYSFLLMYRQAADGSITASNYHELLAAGKLAKEIGCDYFEVKAAFDEGHFIIHTPAALLQDVREQYLALKELEDDAFRILHSSTFISLIERRTRVQSKSYQKCLTTELRTTITPSGVYTCPYHRGNTFAKIGDISEQSFQEMWQNADSSIIDPAKNCTFHCARHESNLEIERLATASPSDFEVVDDFDFFI